MTSLGHNELKIATCYAAEVWDSLLQPDIERLDLKRSKFNDLTRLPLVPHICDSELGKHWLG